MKVLLALIGAAASGLLFVPAASAQGNKNDDDVAGDIVEMIAKAWIEAVAEGDGIDGVTVQVRTLPGKVKPGRTITVYIPPGTLFVPDNKFQPMLSTRGYTIKLQGGGWKKVQIDSVCTAIDKKVAQGTEPSRRPSLSGNSSPRRWRRRPRIT
jgi:hypothetical protein